MPVAVAPKVMACAALLAAGVIAVPPIAPAQVATPHLRTASPAVQLTAAPNPFVYYPEVVERSVANASALFEGYVTASVDAIQAILVHPVDTLLRAAFWALTPQTYLWGAMSLLSPIVTGLAYSIGALWDAASAVVAGVFTGDVVNIFNAVVDIPARIIDGALNEFVSPIPFLYFTGLLVPFQQSQADAVVFPGFLSFGLQLLRGLSAPPPDTVVPEAVGLEVAAVTPPGGVSADSESGPADSVAHALAESDGEAVPLTTIDNPDAGQPQTDAEPAAVNTVTGLDSGSPSASEAAGESATNEESSTAGQSAETRSEPGSDAGHHTVVSIGAGEERSDEAASAGEDADVAQVLAPSLTKPAPTTFSSAREDDGVATSGTDDGEEPGATASGTAAGTDRS